MSTESKEEAVHFHIKQFYTIQGAVSLYDLVRSEVQFHYHHFCKRNVARIDEDQFHAYPVLSQLKQHIESTYGVQSTGAFVNWYQNGDHYAPYHRDSYGGTGVFTVSLGGARMMCTKADDSGKVDKYLLEDGDLFFFNTEFNRSHKHSIPKLKSYQSPRISIVLFV